MRDGMGVVTMMAASVLVALACGGGSISDDYEASTTAPSVDTGTAGGDSILTAGVHFGSELCVKKMGFNCENPTSTFANDTPVIYFVHQTKDIPTAGDVFTIKWIAIDVGDAAPPDTLIAELSPSVDAELLLSISTHYTITSELSIPDAGWPIGSYVVDVVHNGSPVTQAPFTIE